jgi:nucleoid-associated protein YgaU
LTDGDSLERLAQQYLGDAARAEEIYALNRDVLPAPDLLPLGRIIRLPPRDP